MNRFKPKHILIIILIILIGAGLFSLQKVIDRQPEKKEILQSNPAETITSSDYLSAYIGSIIMGGFKPLIVDYLWISADKLKERRQYGEINTLLNLIARLQPKLPDVWSYNAQIMAYNISKGQDTMEGRWAWLEAGINYLKEGLKWNPDNASLMQNIAFIYYHRFPQEQALMDKLEEITGKDCYTISAEWYKESARALAKTKTSAQLASGGEDEYKIETQEVMSIAARFYHLFDLIRKKQYDRSIQEIDELISDSHKVAETYKIDLDLWKKRISGYQAIKSIFLAEKELGKYDLKTNPDEFFNHVSKVIMQYKEVSDKEHVDTIPIRARIETFFIQYLTQLYETIEQKGFGAGKTTWESLYKLIEEATPASSEHISFVFFDAMKQRFMDLGQILNLEQNLIQTPQNNPAFATLLSKTITAYQDYISRYGDMFKMNVEQERLKKLSLYGIPSGGQDMRQEVH